MARETYVLRDGKLVPRSEAAPLVPFGPMSDLACPMTIGDSMSPVQSMADGRWYDSKSAIRRSYTAGPTKFVEVGNDPARLRPPERKKVSRQEVKASVEKAQARFNRGERAA